LDGFEHLAGMRPAAGRGIAPAPSLLLVEDCRLRRDCLRLVLAQRLSGWHIEAAATAREVDAGDPPHIDLILLAGTRIDPNEVATLAALAPVLVCVEDDAPQGGQCYVEAGARGFVPASLGLGALLAAIERVRAGGRYAPAMPRPPRPAAEAAPVRPELTRRQRQVLALITEGKSNKLIADALTMSEDTVKAHVKQIIKRLNVANRTQAALLATRAAAMAARWEAAGS
jgi:DNA-binding NarL/FixJ family response regulator